MRRKYGLRQDEPDKVSPAVRKRQKHTYIWLGILIFVFAVGGMAKAVRQLTAMAWFDDLASIAGGLYFGLFCYPLFTIEPQPPHRGIKFVARLAGIPFALIGIWATISGILWLFQGPR
jgi:hypothetical protein